MTEELKQKSIISQLRHEKTCRGFDVVRFSDGYDRSCNVQKSSQADVDNVWIGFEGGVNRMLIGRSLAAELAALLSRFAETGEIVEMVASGCSEKAGDHIADAGKKAAFKSIDGLVADYNSDPVRKAMIDWARAEVKEKMSEHDHLRDATKLIEQPPMSRERLRQEAALTFITHPVDLEFWEMWQKADAFVDAGYPQTAEESAQQEK
ncbi:MAG: hypothetical protein H7831_17110 [Magnetococcus sp. WYHC-3]